MNNNTRTLAQWQALLEQFCTQSMSVETLLGAYDPVRERRRLSAAASFGLMGIQVAVEHSVGTAVGWTGFWCRNGSCELTEYR